MANCERERLFPIPKAPYQVCSPFQGSLVVNMYPTVLIEAVVQRKLFLVFYIITIFFLLFSIGYNLKNIDQKTEKSAHFIS